MKSYKYAVIYCPFKGYWCGGYGENSEFSKNIEASALIYLDAAIGINSLINGEIEYIGFPSAMQAVTA